MFSSPFSLSCLWPWSSPGGSLPLRIASTSSGGLRRSATQASMSQPASMFNQPFTFTQQAAQHSVTSAIPAPPLGRPYIPQAANISAGLRSKILQGKDINLVSLTLPSPECNKKIITEGNITVFKSVDPWLSSDLSINEYSSLWYLPWHDLFCLSRQRARPRLLFGTDFLSQIWISTTNHSLHFPITHSPELVCFGHLLTGHVCWRLSSHFLHYLWEYRSHCSPLPHSAISTSTFCGLISASFTASPSPVRHWPSWPTGVPSQ